MREDDPRFLFSSAEAPHASTCECAACKPDCSNCGHSFHSHYNKLEDPNYTHGRAPTGNMPKTRNAPCHKRGKHDSRCSCRNYQR